MKQNVWKILAIVFFAISLIEFVWGYAHINNKELKIKELEMKLSNLSPTTPTQDNTEDDPTTWKTPPVK